MGSKLPPSICKCGLVNGEETGVLERSFEATSILARRNICSRCKRSSPYDHRSDVIGRTWWLGKRLELCQQGLQCDSHKERDDNGRRHKGDLAIGSLKDARLPSPFRTKAIPSGRDGIGVALLFSPGHGCLPAEDAGFEYSSRRHIFHGVNRHFEAGISQDP